MVVIIVVVVVDVVVVVVYKVLAAVAAAPAAAAATVTYPERLCVLNAISIIIKGCLPSLPPCCLYLLYNDCSPLTACA